MNKSENSRVWWKNYEFYMLVANIVVALGALGALWVSYRSLKSADESLRLTREAMAGSDRKDSAIISATEIAAQATSELVFANREHSAVFREAYEAQNRAYINIISDAPISYDTILQVITFNYVYKNEGKSPAYKLAKSSYVFYDSICPNPARYKFKKVLRSASTSTYGPNSEGYLIASPYHLPWNEYKLVLSGKRKLGVVAYIVYEDAFGRSHFTNCYFTYHPEVDGFINNNGYNYNSSD